MEASQAKAHSALRRCDVRSGVTVCCELQSALEHNVSAGGAELDMSAFRGGGGLIDAFRIVSAHVNIQCLIFNSLGLINNV